MAVPKFRPSKARSRRRQSINMRIAVPGLITCSNCGDRTILHRVCRKCGFYKGKMIIEPDKMG
ncbi:MAG: 50S ribosomal protein L32 [Spirochaeta sp. LUC14_002_19_P3]|nr:MAG: 50S ribosomal protein L32 [Spirochaeta sp. LUC14_002_19_P3]